MPILSWRWWRLGMACRIPKKTIGGSIGQVHDPQTGHMRHDNVHIRWNFLPFSGHFGTEWDLELVRGAKIGVGRAKYAQATGDSDSLVVEIVGGVGQALANLLGRVCATQFGFVVATNYDFVLKLKMKHM